MESARMTHYTRVSMLIKNGTKIALEEAADEFGVSVPQIINLVADGFRKRSITIRDGRLYLNPFFDPLPIEEDEDE